jgi:hypothetical protein
MNLTQNTQIHHITSAHLELAAQDNTRWLTLRVGNAEGDENRFTLFAQGRSLAAVVELARMLYEDLRKILGEEVADEADEMRRAICDFAQEAGWANERVRSNPHVKALLDIARDAEGGENNA